MALRWVNKRNSESCRTIHALRGRLANKEQSHRAQSQTRAAHVKLDHSRAVLRLTGRAAAAQLRTRIVGKHRVLWMNVAAFQRPVAGQELTLLCPRARPPMRRASAFHRQETHHAAALGVAAGQPRHPWRSQCSPRKAAAHLQSRCCVLGSQTAKLRHTSRLARRSASPEVWRAPSLP